MSLIAKENRLFVIDLEYTVPFDQIEPVLALHRETARLHCEMFG